MEVVKSAKLLGVIISSDLKWNEHTRYICKKPKQRLWFLRRLSKLGASRVDLLNLFQLMTRSILEQASPVFTSGLSKTNIKDIENIQKSAFKIILRGNYKDYNNALSVLGQDTLEYRRNLITFKFAKNCLNHPKMNHLFQRRKNVKTRSGNRFIESRFKSSRGYNGPIQFMTRLLNQNYK